MNTLSEALELIDGQFGDAVLLRHNENLIYALHDLYGQKRLYCAFIVRARALTTRFTQLAETL